ncbi:MAG: hypothetical protein BZY88_02510 [SAR202 cluster bacterium Io17-Chloro-G9]|nr:MAG: hypothetical protein BZY88_02510 [SAR202 cluster bacterium Io17-Chloro-G9]
MTIDSIAIIRDIFLIVSAGVLVVAVVLGGLVAFRLYRSIQRTAQNVEAISGVLLESVARPLSHLPTLVELGRTALGWVQEYRARQGRYQEDDEE